MNSVKSCLAVFLCFLLNYHYSFLKLSECIFPSFQHLGCFLVNWDFMINFVLCLKILHRTLTQTGHSSLFYHRSHCSCLITHGARLKKVVGMLHVTPPWGKPACTTSSAMYGVSVASCLKAGVCLPRHKYMLCLWQFWLGLGPIGGPSLLLYVLLLSFYCVSIIILLSHPYLPSFFVVVVNYYHSTTD